MHFAELGENSSMTNQDWKLVCEMHWRLWLKKGGVGGSPPYFP